ncbi:MAG TPA: DNA primase [Actinomycetes bacterium]|nr:DNA primase [Actinomycetes bacterium]
MPGRIRDEDIALVRERSPIADVVGERVTLRNAGGGSLKGLCPFHEEKTPSFHVTAARGLYFCFGCQAGGDVFDFVMRVDHLTFAETIERLAGRAGIQLRYVEGGATTQGQQGRRTRLVEAHKATAEFYADQLGSPAAQPARRLLAERGFDQAAAVQFSVGFAPQAWDTLTKHLRARGFTDDELRIGGLARDGQRGLMDRFRGRLMWPIRDITGDVIGFGARRLFEDDNGPKYLNTPETPLYRKSQVLYGVDLAKREIARRMQAVVVEGYTDVMACHLAGVPTAIATCGTAFGGEHIKILRRLLMDQNEFRGEVIFTFDGDEAGRKAALRAFEDDQRFVAQTFVAIEPDGLDPCDLRVRRGEVAVRDLVARRVPMFEFAIRSALEPYDLDSAEGRVAALRRAVPMVASIRDRALRPEYTKRLAGWLGMDIEPVAAAVAGVAGRTDGEPAAVPADKVARPDPLDPALQVEREALKLGLQVPQLAGPVFDATEADMYTADAYRSVRLAIAGAGGVATATSGPGWVAAVRESAPDDAVRTLVTELAVEPVRSTGDPDPRYTSAVLARLAEMAMTRRITELKSKLQRTNPLTAEQEYNRLFGELIALESQARGLRERAIGAL